MMPEKVQQLTKQLGQGEFMAPAEQWQRRREVVRRFAMGVAASLTALGIVNLLRWLREPVIGTRRRAT
ncbi:MAG TPA: hypothetical protein VGW38_26225 [Chloroflexota bacterium]|nr:hypothetical protein [Chloroflexota bacterium]